MKNYYKRKTPSSSTSDHVTEQATKEKPKQPIGVIDLNNLPWDPINRPRILQYNVNQRDDIRRKYWNQGPCQPSGHGFKRTIIDDFGHRGGNEAFVTEGFNGNLPQSFNNLSSLKVFEISSNHFTGIIPPSVIANLTSLEYINFGHNKFEGLLSFSTFSTLKNLVPVEFKSDNDIFEVETEESLGWIPMFQLQVLVLSNCNVNMHKENVIPSFLLHQHELQVLDLSHNSLQGHIPNWLVENNTMLQVFVPGDIGKFLPFIIFLNLSRNVLSGTIPSSIANISMFHILDLSDNQFSGEVPQELFKLDNLSILQLSHNGLDGQVFSGNISLYWFNMLLVDHNYFTGRISNNKSFDVAFLDISNNLFSGAFLDGMSNSSEAFILSVRNNSFEGKFPCGIATFTFLDVSHNSFSGPIPPCTNFRYMVHLQLQSNKFTGSIPKTFLDIEGIVTLDISNNYLSGRIPKFVGQLLGLRVLLLGKNNFRGSIPEELCQLTLVSLIDISSNSLSGSIPRCLQNIASPYYLGSYLEIEGTQANVQFTTKSMPRSYEGRILDYMSGVDLSCNKLRGKLPDMKRQFGTFTAASYKGNPLLCGPPLEKTCANTSPVTTSPEDGTSAKEDEICWRRWWLFFIEESMHTCYYFLNDLLMLQEDKKLADKKAVKEVDAKAPDSLKLSKIAKQKS
ncbi:receptor like protein 1 [Tanacetum coccineum]